MQGKVPSGPYASIDLFAGCGGLSEGFLASGRYVDFVGNMSGCYKKICNAAPVNFARAIAEAVYR